METSLYRCRMGYGLVVKSSFYLRYNAISVNHFNDLFSFTTQQNKRRIHLELIFFEWKISSSNGGSYFKYCCMWFVISIGMTTFFLLNALDILHSFPLVAFAAIHSTPKAKKLHALALLYHYLWVLDWH